MSELSSGTSAAGDGSVEHLFTTNEGPLLITTRGKMVFIAESFPLPLARQLTALILDAQGAGPMHMAQTPLELRTLSLAPDDLSTPSLAPDTPRGALTFDLVHFFAEAGVMKSVVDAERLALRKSLVP